MKIPGGTEAGAVHHRLQVVQPSDADISSPISIMTEEMGEAGQKIARHIIESLDDYNSIITFSRSCYLIGLQSIHDKLVSTKRI